LARSPLAISFVRLDKVLLIVVVVVDLLAFIYLLSRTNLDGGLLYYCNFYRCVFELLDRVVAIQD
jgi:hypothetical protein